MRLLLCGVFLFSCIFMGCKGSGKEVVQAIIKTAFRAAIKATTKVVQALKPGPPRLGPIDFTSDFTSRYFWIFFGFLMSAISAFAIYRVYQPSKRCQMPDAQ